MLASQQESRLFQTLITTLPHLGVLVVGSASTIIQAAGVLPGLLLHRQAPELVGQALLDQVLEDYRPDWQRYLDTAWAGESHFFSDHWNAWRCECFVGPVTQPNGQVEAVLVVFRNVTEAYRQQQALLSLNQALLVSNQQLEQLAYVASHDLQEPLRKILFYSDRISVEATHRLTALEQDMLNRMQAAAQRMSELIDSLLEQAQLQGPAPTRTLVSLADLLSTLVSDLSVIIQERAALVELEPPLPTLIGDAAQLRQLFQNLLSNALKFTPPGVAPRIRIQARLVEPEQRAALALPLSGTYAQVSVADQGIGMASEDLAGIFGLFTRLHGRHPYAGSGLGLATVKQVVDNHQGSIWVESQEGIGTTIHVYLPIAPP
jgi:signal transduction histidine kinase